MVHVKRVELTNFKSFGGTTSVPLLPGFTVISGPNGSGKSNILDALLFCLGLASSKGMRADRLPDLVNNAQKPKGRSAVEASVTVTFDLTDQIITEEENAENPQAEWSVTRKLRVTHQGTYTSNYYINGVSCTLTELHEELDNLRIYPEGYNVVLQGDVTSIISMNAKERREIIDELAGVAAFDRKIHQAKDTLDEVKEKEDSCRIIHNELTAQRDRLSQDRAKAEKYQKLRTEFQSKQSWSAVLSWRALQAHREKLVMEIQTGDETLANLSTQLININGEIDEKTVILEQLNLHVKALGEEELLRIQTTLATQAAEHKQLQRQQQELETTLQGTIKRLTQINLEIQQYERNLEQAITEQVKEDSQVIALKQERDTAQQALLASHQAAAEVATASEIWVQQQTALNRQIETLLQTLEPQRTEQAQLRERNDQLQQLIQEQSQLVATLAPQLVIQQVDYAELAREFQVSAGPIQDLATNLSATEQELQIQQETQKRLLQEQRDKQRQLDKIEAMSSAQQEVQGTQASKVILQSGMPGLCGLVVQLGGVEPQYQLALEIAAGGRLGYIVVEDDGVAAVGIELLKQKRAGRATFLPLNKIRPPKFIPEETLRYADGFINYAVNLVECDRRYQDVFNYVFGSTVVFSTLTQARKNLGLHRIVTLDGDLLETSGAMTGGSNPQRSGLRFGTPLAAESEEAVALKSRLQDIERILERSLELISTLTINSRKLTQELTDARQIRREKQLQLEQLQKDIKSLTEQLTATSTQLDQNKQKFTTVQSRLQVLEQELPLQEAELQSLRQNLVELEASQTPSEWQTIQMVIKHQEQEFQQRDTAFREAEQRLKNWFQQQELLQGRIQSGNVRVEEYQQERETQQTQMEQLLLALAMLMSQMGETQANLAQIEQHLGEEKQKRDQTEVQVRSLLLRQQQLQWEIEKLREVQSQRREDLFGMNGQLQTLGAELPSPLPEVPDQVDLEELQKELRSLAKRLQAMEPVNMLALEEHEKVQHRLEELTQKLETLEAERTELLLRIENFTTLRQIAFKEAFDAVNTNFQSIFAVLSDGDGYLQLEQPEDPFHSGLNLVAHPKGKPVQRLASMSGGEKSLTALSFIFSLQRYRPSPFYAFDEVDMFLDGANVERLARMIKQQAQQAQFIVVSLRRPMIESAERTIGVTQARGAHTQVLGIKLKTSNT